MASKTKKSAPPDTDDVVITPAGLKGGKMVPVETITQKLASGKILHTGSSQEPNGESLEALAELEAGELTHYADTADMFKKLGIKVGKA